MYGVGFGIGAIGATTKRSSGIAIDADAQAFFTANSTLTDATTKTAINQFVLDLKSYSLWSSGKYMYLGFLGNSTKCSYNLFNPSAYQLTISSGWTFDSQGMQGNGTSAYAQTSFIPSGNTNKNSQSIGVYSQTNVDEVSTDIGSIDASSNREHILLRTGNIAIPQLATTGYYTPSVTDSRGYFLASRNSSSSFTMYKGTSQILNDIGANTTVDIAIQDFIGALNNNSSAQLFSSRKYSAIFRFTALTQTQSNNLKTCIDTLLTSLSITTY